MNYHDIFKKMAADYYSANTALLKRMGEPMANEIIGVKKLKPGWTFKHLPDIISPGVKALFSHRGDAAPAEIHAAMKVEDAASIVCHHGQDSTISSKSAAEKIIQEIESGNVTEEHLEKVQNIVKEYRNGLGLEESTKKIIDLLDPMSNPLFDLPGILNNIKYNYQQPLVAPFGGIGNGQIPTIVNSGHKIGDIVENKNTLASLPGPMWLWCDGAYVYQDIYPDLYQELQFSTACNNLYKWGYVFDEQIESFTGRTKFNVPLIPLNMIKAL